VFLFLYVNDIFITSKYKSELRSLKEKLSSKFEIKDCSYKVNSEDKHKNE